MKKLMQTLLLVSAMMFCFSIPVMAYESVATEQSTEASEQGIAPFTEMTRLYWRNHQGQPQWRLWSITNGRWLTEWTNVNPL